MYGKQWKKPANEGEEVPRRVFHILRSSPTFETYYDEVQESLKSMAGMDELLQGVCVWSGKLYTSQQSNPGVFGIEQRSKGSSQ